MERLGQIFFKQRLNDKRELSSRESDLEESASYIFKAERVFFTSLAEDIRALLSASVSSI